MEVDEKLIKYLMGKTHLKREEIREMTHERFIELVNAHIEDDTGMNIKGTIESLWNYVRELVADYREFVNSFTYTELSKITGADEKYLRERFDLDSALELLYKCKEGRGELNC